MPAWFPPRSLNGENWRGARDSSTPRFAYEARRVCNELHICRTNFRHASNLQAACKVQFLKISLITQKLRILLGGEFDLAQCLLLTCQGDRFMKALTLTQTWPAQSWHLKESFKSWFIQLFVNPESPSETWESVDFFSDEADLENYLQSFRE